MWWTRAGVIIGLSGTVFLIWNLFYVRRSTDAAVNANKVVRESMIADNRAWLSVSDIMAEGDFRSGKWGAEMTISIKITNAGKTPALDAHTHIEMVPYGGDVPDLLRALCQKNKTKTPWGRLVLPTESYRRPWGPTTSLETIESVGSKYGSFVVIGCVTYQVLHDENFHQTAFVYHPTARGGKGFIAFGNNVPKSEISFTVGSGGFAT